MAGEHGQPCGVQTPVGALTAGRFVPEECISTGFSLRDSITRPDRKLVSLAGSIETVGRYRKGGPGLFYGPYYSKAPILWATGAIDASSTLRHLPIE